MSENQGGGVKGLLMMMGDKGFVVEGSGIWRWRGKGFVNDGVG